MSNKEKAIAIVEEMVNRGYFLYNETTEDFAKRFDYDTELLESFKERFFKAL